MITNNFFDYYNRFWQAGEGIPFTTSATSLYLYLLYEANRRFWKMPIQCSTQFLAFRLNLSKQSICDARELLRERGFLQYIGGNKHGALAQYTITLPPIDEVSSNQSSKASSDQSSEVSSDQSSEVSSNQSSEASSACLTINNGHNSNNNNSKQTSFNKNAREETSLTILKEIFSNDLDWLQHIVDTLDSPKVRSPDDVRSYLTAFFNEQTAQGIKVREEMDCRKHFFFWLKKIINKAKSNGIQNRLSPERRGTPVSTGTAADFEQPFNASNH